MFAHGLPIDGFCSVELRHNGGQYSTDWARSFAETYKQVVSEMLAKDALQDVVLVSEHERDLLDGMN